MFKQWLQVDFTLSKRDLGILMIVAGAALAALMLAMEVIGTNSAGLGTVQWIGILGGGGAALVGLTLLPLRDQQA